MYYFVNKKKYCQICTCSARFYFTLFVCTQFCNKIEWCRLKKSLKYFSILWVMKNDVRFENTPWKISDFISFSWFGLTLAIKRRNLEFENHWNLFFLSKIYDIRFELCPVKQCLIYFKPPCLSRILAIS